MPHLTVEYTDNIRNFDCERLLAEMVHSLAETPHFEEIDIKSRAVSLSVYRVGEHAETRGFVHVRLAILSGRSPDVKAELSAGLLEVLRLQVPSGTDLELQLCVEIQDIDRASYAKTAIGGDGP